MSSGGRGNMAGVSRDSVQWSPALQAAVSADVATRARDAAARADAFYHRGDFRSALPLYADAARLQPAVPQYHFGLAAAALRSDRRELVEPHLLETIRLDPNHAAAHDALGQWYLMMDQPERARDHTAAALALEPGNRDFTVSHGFALSAAGQAREAWALIEPIVASGAAADPQLAILCARLAPQVGREDRATAVIAEALRSPALPASPARPSLHLAAAELFERQGRYDDAFDQARLPNEATRRPYDPAAHADWVSRQIRYFTPARLKALPRATHGDRRPVLIVGMPRWGTSLVEQILDSPPAVAGRGELATLGRFVGSLSVADGPARDLYPEAMDSMSIRAANRLASEYLADLASGVEPDKSDAACLTDKTPLNFYALGLAEVLLPGCRVIHCVRNPLDSCLSCYFTRFAFGHEFSADLSHLGAFYRDYRRLMAHWGRVLSLPMLDVRYEDVVLDAETEVRRVLDFLGLPWGDRCLQFHRNPRRVATASKSQVRRPLYATSIGRWKHYEKHLGDLFDALGGRGQPAGGIGGR